MAEEIRKVLNLSLGESPKNVRELKADIGELKTAIGDMVIAGKTGTTEYDQAVKLLGQDLQTLLQVNNATKKEVDALDGSYNALVQRMRELKVEWRATNSEARRNELGKQISDINNQLKAFDYSIGNFGRNVQSAVGSKAFQYRCGAVCLEKFVAGRMVNHGRSS